MQCVVEIGNNDSATNTEIQDNVEKLIFCIDLARDRIRNFIDGDFMKTAVQATRLRKASIAYYTYIVIVYIYENNFSSFVKFLQPWY